MKGDDRARVREALARAAGSSAPEVDRLVGAVPALVARARRQRANAAAEPAGLGVRAWGILPRLAAATAGALVLAAAAGLTGGTGSSSAEASSLDSLILGEGEDVLLQAVTGDEGSDG